MKLFQYTIAIIAFLVLVGCDNSTLEERKIYFKNGKLKEKYFIDKEKRKQGYTFLYYPNGKLKAKAKFNDNLQIDTTFNYLDNGHLNVIVINDMNGYRIKEISFFPNKKIHVMQSYFVDGSGQINAWKTYFENGMINEPESNFAKLDVYGKNRDSVEVKLYNCNFTDSIRVNIIKSFDFEYDFDAEIVRTLIFSKTKNLKFKLLKSDFVKRKVNIQIITEKWVSPKSRKINSYPIQISKGTYPKDNVEGIYRVY